MNYFLEGQQGAGKSTLLEKLLKLHPESKAYREGLYCPVELAWNTYMDEISYNGVLEKYPFLSENIKARTVVEDGRYIIEYTQILTEDHSFHRDLEQYEIYNGNIEAEEFEEIILKRLRNWSGDNEIFECAIFQNIIENMILYLELPDDEIIAFYKRMGEVLATKEYKLIYLQVDDIRATIDVIRKERLDNAGVEWWYTIMMKYLESSPFFIHNDLKGMDGFVKHLEHRRRLELRIIDEVFKNNAIILKSKNYTDEELKDL